MPTWRLGPAALLALVVLTGCAGLLSGAEPQGEETLTPAPVGDDGCPDDDCHYPAGAVRCRS